MALAHQQQLLRALAVLAVHTCRLLVRKQDATAVRPVVQQAHTSVALAEVPATSHALVALVEHTTPQRVFRHRALLAPVAVVQGHI